MNSILSSFLIRSIIPAALVVLLSTPAESFAQSASSAPAEQDHIVSSLALQQQVEGSSADRQKNIDTINGLLATPEAQRAMRDSHFDAEQVRSAVPMLSDQELANLAARASNAQRDFAAGHIGPSLFTIIIILIIVIIIVAVIH
jgi:hypothetical protein